MYGHNLTHTIRNAAALWLSAIFLTACLSGGGSDSPDPSPNPSPNPPPPPPPPTNSAPQITGTPAAAVVAGNEYLFMPNASDPDGDSLTFRVENMPSWAAFDTSNGELSGQPTAEHVGLYENIVISASDGQASDSLPQFSISVDANGNLSTTLSWTAPTQNEDGSQLTDLAGFKIYWGTSVGTYPNSVTIDNPGILTYVVENLSAGTYYFVATAFNATGEESRFSGVATRVLQ
jgi:hypothetical protein